MIRQIQHAQLTKLLVGVRLVLSRPLTPHEKMRLLAPNDVYCEEGEVVTLYIPDDGREPVERQT